MWQQCHFKVFLCQNHFFTTLQKKSIMNISILVPKGPVVLSSVVGSYKIFNAVNKYLIDSGKRMDPLFNVEIVGTTATTALYDGAFQINCHKTLDEVKTTDLAIMAAICGDITCQLQDNAELVEWIRKQYLEKDTEIASLCMSAFLMAQTGLLNGKKCATHWFAADAFRAAFPEVNLVSDSIITHESGIYSSGGAYSFLNLILYFIEKYAGREAAVWAAKFFEIELDRVSQDQFVIFSTQHTHTDENILKAQHYIEQHYHKSLSVSAIAEKHMITRRNFIRRFKKATNNTPIEYIQRVKIEAAKRRFESGNCTINEVMYEVGYNDSRTFREAFKKITGLSPTEYRNRYNVAFSMAQAS